MANDSFWANFLRPLREKESPEKYGFNKYLNLKPELTLEKNESKDSRCLSRMILTELQAQTEQTEKGKKRKATECKLELGRLIKTGDVESRSRESSRSAHFDVTPSTPVARFRDSVSATNLTNPERVNQRGSRKLEASGIMGKVLLCIKYWLGYRRPKVGVITGIPWSSSFPYIPYIYIDIDKYILSDISNLQMTRNYAGKLAVRKLQRHHRMIQTDFTSGRRTHKCLLICR